MLGFTYDALGLGFTFDALGNDLCVGARCLKRPYKTNYWYSGGCRGVLGWGGGVLLCVLRWRDCRYFFNHFSTGP